MDHQLVAAYHYHLKARMQLYGESLQETAAAIDQLANWALVGLPADIIQREAAHTFGSEVKDLRPEEVPPYG
jgi:hypothetical protein